MLKILQILLINKVVTINVSLIEKNQKLIIKWLKPTNQELIVPLVYSKLCNNFTQSYQPKLSS